MFENEEIKKAINISFCILLNFQIFFYSEILQVLLVWCSEITI